MIYYVSLALFAFWAPILGTLAIGLVVNTQIGKRV